MDLNIKIPRIVERKRRLKHLLFIEWKPRRFMSGTLLHVSWGLEAYDGIMDQEYEKNLISNKFAVKLGLQYELKKNGEKVVTVRLTKGVVDFRSGILTIYPHLITFNDDSDDELDALLASIDVDDLPPLNITDIPPFEMEEDLYKRILILNEKRPIIETFKYSDQHKKLLDSVLLDKLKLDEEFEVEEEIVGEEFIKGNKAIKEKNDPLMFVLPIRLEGKYNYHALVVTGSNINIMPYRIYELLGRDQVNPKSDKVRMLDHSNTDPMGRLLDVLCQVGVTTILAIFMLLDVPMDRDVPLIVKRSFLHTLKNVHAESDSDDDEEYCLKRDDMGKPIYGPNRAKYLSSDDPMDRALALQEALNPFKKIYVWKKVIAFLGALPVPLQNAEWVPNRSGNTAKENGDGKPQGTCNRNVKKLCHEFYSTYEFDEEVTDEELISKKLIKFRLGGRGHSLSLLEFARRLGLYHSVKICEEEFKVYFQGGLRSDEHFNATDYWLSISNEDELHLSRSSTQTIRSPVLRVLHKMITYGLCQRMTRYDKIQRNELWLMSMFEAKHQNGMAKKMNLLTDEVLDGLSAPIYYRSLDATTLRELIGPNGRLVAKDLTPCVSRVAMPRPSRPTMQDLYDMMGRMEICQGELERMSRRKLFHSDRYDGVFEYMVGHYGVPLIGPYAPLGYDEQQ
ncbi:retrotransposon ORF1 [Tanacetum coccineum]